MLSMSSPGTPTARSSRPSSSKSPAAACLPKSSACSGESRSWAAAGGARVSEAMSRRRGKRSGRVMAVLGSGLEIGLRRIVVGRAQDEVMLCGDPRERLGAQRGGFLTGPGADLPEEGQEALLLVRDRGEDEGQRLVARVGEAVPGTRRHVPDGSRANGHLLHLVALERVDDAFPGEEVRDLLGRVVPVHGERATFAEREPREAGAR